MGVCKKRACGGGAARNIAWASAAAIAGAIAAAIFVGAAVSGCSDRGFDRQDRFLYKTLDAASITTEGRFTAVNTLAARLSAEKDYPRLILFLTDYAEKHTGDPFRPYWLLLTAYAYLETGSAPIAELYFDRIVRSSKDLLVQGESVHYRCLQQLLALSDDPAARIDYYGILGKHFSDRVNLGEMHFRTGVEYERLGDWDAAVRAYAAFLAQPNPSALLIPGYTDPYSYARKLTGRTALGDGARTNTFATLADLVRAVQTALADHNYSALNGYMSKVNFFAMSWKQSESDRNATRSFYLGNFMSGRTIHFSPDVDEDASRPGEVYLRTWGWSQQSTSWYFVFRRANFPADPEVHGRWEWAGIYYGERF
jgi:tetratricopeptide (TPR) repeat protein